MLADYLVPCKYRAVYMAVTNDKYELPTMVAESCLELGAMLGVSASMVSRHITGRRMRYYQKGLKIVRVYVEDEHESY